jgi:murein L,D-transpeptidase YcbB/YkuD
MRYPIAGGVVLKPGMKDGRIPTLRNRLLRVDQKTLSAQESLLYDQEFEQSGIKFQRRHYLEGDGIMGKHTLQMLNQT